MMLKPFGFNRADTGGGDVTAPTLSSPVDAANGATAATGSVDTNEGNGTLYWVVTQSATSPSAAQVKAGNDHTGSAGDDSGSQAVSGTGTQTLSPAPSGLTASTTYYIHYMHEDAATNQSSVSSADGFTTSAAASVLDDFNRADENLEASANWTGSIGYPAGNIAVVSNQVRMLGDYEFSMVAHNDTRANDQWAELEFVSVNATDTYFAGPAVRVSDGVSGANGYIALYGAAASEIYVAEIDNGSLTTLQTYTSSALSPGDVLRISISGTTITTSVNGVDKSPTVASGGAFSSGDAGVFGSTGGGGSVTWDNFDAGDV